MNTTLLTDEQIDAIPINEDGEPHGVSETVKQWDRNLCTAQDLHTKSLLADEVRKMIKKESKHFNTDVFNALQAVLKLMEGKE